MPKRHHTPIRTCVACRETDEKRDLLRVVRQPDQTVVHDPKGKLSGRGAYICAREACITLARKRKQLERALKVTALSDDLFTTLYARAAQGAVTSEHQDQERPATEEGAVSAETTPEREGE